MQMQDNGDDGDNDSQGRGYQMPGKRKRRKQRMGRPFFPPAGDKEQEKAIHPRSSRQSLARRSTDGTAAVVVWSCRKTGRKRREKGDQRTKGCHTEKHGKKTSWRRRRRRSGCRSSEQSFTAETHIDSLIRVDGKRQPKTHTRVASL